MSALPEKDNPKLREVEINLTAQELADIIWLMVQINPSIDTAEVAAVPPQGNSPTISLPPPNSESIDFPEIVKSIENTTPAYVDSHRNHPSESASAGLPLKVTDPLALRNTLALGRSLRPLMRKAPSLTEMILNEEATVTSIAEKDFWLPVLQPVSTQWLEVALVIEETARYPLWRQILTEFQQLLERHGAFRNVSLWHIKMGGEGEVQLYLKHRQASLKELNDPSGRRLIWLVSDCVSPIWHNGSLLKVLRDWARIQPVSLLQLLPERLWSRTALGWGIEVKLYSENPGVPNSRLLKTHQLVDKQFYSPQALTLPIVTLESFPMKNWAKVLAGVGGSRTPGLVFLPEKITPQASANDNEDKQLSPKARVSRFQAAASPLSRQLARMMAAAPVSLPVIRLIQQTLLSGSHAVHLAEVLMGGLLKPTAEQPREGVNEEVNYEFYPGVREELIKITRKSQTIDVILCVSEFINRELQLRQPIRNFDAMLFNPDVEVDPNYLPFAWITAQTLQLLGGKYADMGEQIQQKLILASQSQNVHGDNLQFPQQRYLLFQHNNSRIYSCLTDEPWKLPFDAFVISSGTKIGMSGSLFRSLSEYIGKENNDELQRIIHLVLAQQNRKEITPQLPLVVPLPTQINRLLQPTESELEHFLICATVESPKAIIKNVAVAVESVITLSLERQLQRIVISLLGAGNNLLSKHQVAQVMLSKLSQLLSVSSNSLVEITIVAKEQSTVEIINQSAQNLPTSPLPLMVFEYQTPTVNRRGEIIQRQSKTAQYFTENLPNNITLDMVSIPGGKFLMGSPKTETGRSDSESPQHEVKVPAFFMGKYPVTQAQWRAVAALKRVNHELKPNPSRFKGSNRPVERISWDSAVEFCNRLSKQTGKTYCLPSEAQWEYACRAGTSTPFHFGETITSELANHNSKNTYGAEIQATYRDETTEVGSFKVANAFGLYDMHGNVWEWCLDDWHVNYEGAPTDGSAWLDDNELSQTQTRSLLRGGAYFESPKNCRSACRKNFYHANYFNYVGFRVVYKIEMIF